MCAVYRKEAKWVRMEKCGGKWGMARGVCHLSPQCRPLSTQIFPDFSETPHVPSEIPPRHSETLRATPRRSQLSSNKKTPEYLSACLRFSEVLRSLDVGTASNVRRFSPSPYVLLDLFVREVPSRITVSRRIHALGILSSLEHSSGPNVDSKLIWWSSE